MSTIRRTSLLAPFGQRSFRFQWPADLATSWAFEMETLILGWYVLAETGSVVWLTVFAALQSFGTLISPLYGVMGDRAGHRTVLCAMRAAYALLAAVLALLAFTGLLGPVPVILVAALSGLVRPSDIGMRNALIGATMPPGLLMGAMSIARTSADAARVAGALTGAGLGGLLGMAHACLALTGLYLLSLALTLRIGEPRGAGEAARAAGAASAWRDLGEGIVHAWTTPPLLAALCLAFLANLAAYPLSGGLLPHVARDVYGIDRAGLGYLAASFAGGALAGSLALGVWGVRLRPGRTMVVACLLWFALLLVFSRQESAAAGMVLLALAGFVQSFCMVPMAVLLLRVSREAFRGRVMGLRMLAVYGLPIGLLAAGPAVERAGFAAAASLYAGLGLLLALAVALRWRAHLWPAGAPANRLAAAEAPGAGGARR
ncbi:MFS transporter [Caldovatus aquaticus]|uniref:MFS transporter n=1 Tax=Caldovatus aquaticus TaxID=2865671 RepID=UPI002106E817|nr:MFS transporter [Caldovatus aquaticus]